MRVILGMANCPKCKQLKEKHPDWKYIELDMALLLALGRATGIATMPMILSTEE